LAKKKDRETIYRLINQYIDALKQRNINVAGSFLFGSYAKGNPSESSDIDLAILTDKLMVDGVDFRFLLMKIAREIDVDIEPHAFLIDEFNEHNPLAVEILKTGEKVNF
jgi:predicted nucleotidyltransferase